MKELDGYLMKARGINVKYLEKELDGTTGTKLVLQLERRETSKIDFTSSWK